MSHRASSPCPPRVFASYRLVLPGLGYTATDYRRINGRDYLLLHQFILVDREVGDAW